MEEYPLELERPSRIRHKKDGSQRRGYKRLEEVKTNGWRAEYTTLGIDCHGGE